MTEESRFPIEFKECPNCGCTDTVCRLAYKEEVVDKGKGPDVFASAEKKPMPLISPQIAVFTAPILVEHFDTCARCGLRYCTKAEIAQGKIEIRPGKGPPLMPQQFSPS